MCISRKKWEDGVHGTVSWEFAAHFLLRRNPQALAIKVKYLGWVFFFS